MCHGASYLNHFSGLPWFILFHLALQGSGTRVHLTSEKHVNIKFFLPIILLFAQQIKYPLVSGCYKTL